MPNFIGTQFFIGATDLLTGVKVTVVAEAAAFTGSDSVDGTLYLRGNDSEEGQGAGFHFRTGSGTGAAGSGGSYVVVLGQPNDEGNVGLFEIYREGDGTPIFQAGQGTTIIIASLTVGQTLITCPSAGTLGLRVRAASGQTEDLQTWTNDSATTLSRIQKGGRFGTRVNSVPADADVATSEVQFWFDDTNGAAKVKFKGKQADGTVRTGEVALS